MRGTGIKYTTFSYMLLAKEEKAQAFACYRHGKNKIKYTESNNIIIITANLPINSIAPRLSQA